MTRLGLTGIVTPVSVNNGCGTAGKLIFIILDIVYPDKIENGEISLYLQISTMNEVPFISIHESTFSWDKELWGLCLNLPLQDIVNTFQTNNDFLRIPKSTREVIEKIIKELKQAYDNLPNP